MNTAGLSSKIAAKLRAFDAWATTNRMVVQTTRSDDGSISTQRFANAESRDEYVARAQRLGHKAIVL